MQNETEKTIEEYISMAPETIKNFIASGDWKNDAKNIADKFKLTEENTNDFFDFPSFGKMKKVIK
jgi:anti-sigma28 factor (negative regulator of flagellin synthesis)